MQPLELRVTEEQVRAFLLEEADSYLDDSQSPDPTNGIQNYAVHAMEAEDIAQRNRPFMHPDIQPYFQRVFETGADFQWSLQEVIAVWGNKGEAVKQHYQILTQLPALHQEGAVLIGRDLPRDKPTLSKVVNLLRGQIVVANHVCDPQRRKQEWEFRHKIWGETTDFINYVKQLDN